MSKLDTAYWAGFFDARGRVFDNRDSYMLTVSSTNREMVAAFHEFVQVGSASPTKPRKVGHTPGLIWQGTHRNALIVARLLAPYCRARRADLEKVMAHYAA